INRYVSSLAAHPSISELTDVLFSTGKCQCAVSMKRAVLKFTDVFLSIRPAKRALSVESAVPELTDILFHQATYTCLNPLFAVPKFVYVFLSFRVPFSALSIFLPCRNSPTYVPPLGYHSVPCPSAYQFPSFSYTTSPMNLCPSGHVISFLHLQ